MLPLAKPPAPVDAAYGTELYQRSPSRGRAHAKRSASVQRDRTGTPTRTARPAYGGAAQGALLNPKTGLHTYGMEWYPAEHYEGKYNPHVPGLVCTGCRSDNVAATTAWVCRWAECGYENAYDADDHCGQCGLH